MNDFIFIFFTQPKLYLFVVHVGQAAHVEHVGHGGDVVVEKVVEKSPLKVGHVVVEHGSGAGQTSGGGRTGHGEGAGQETGGEHVGHLL